MFHVPLNLSLQQVLSCQSSFFSCRIRLSFRRNLSTSASAVSRSSSVHTWYMVNAPSRHPTKKHPAYHITLSVYRILPFFSSFLFSFFHRFCIFPFLEIEIGQIHFLEASNCNHFPAFPLYQRSRRKGFLLLFDQQGDHLLGMLFLRSLLMND